jgi:polyhydroxyalkanoate synthesis regulator phasin
MDNLIYSSAVLTLSQPTQSARHKSIDTTIIHLIVSKGLNKFTIKNVYDSINDEFPIRYEEIEKSLLRSYDIGIVDKVGNGSQNPQKNLYELSLEYRKKLDVQSGQIKSFLDNAIKELFPETSIKGNCKELQIVLMEALARLMAKYGYAYASQLTGGTEASEFVPKEELKKICISVIQKCHLDLDPNHLAEAIGILFDRRDPDLNSIAFSICNRYYLSRLIGLDLPIDFLSENIYKNSTIYLDTNFILSIAFSKEQKHNEFIHILKYTDQLGIKFSVLELTLAEIYKRVYLFKDILTQGSDYIPDELMDEVKNDIIHSEESNTVLDDDFDLLSTPEAAHLKSMGIEIIPFPKENEIVKRPEFKVVSQELTDYDHKVRTYAKHKDENAIFHDTYFYFLIDEIRSHNKITSAWFLTRDNSVIQHSLFRIKTNQPPYAIKLLTLLQTLSPFVESQALKGEFADLFAELISKDLLPTEHLLSLDDLKMLVGFDVRSKSIPPEFIRKATLHIKTKILKGGGITAENRNLVVQEYLKYLATPEQNFVEFHKKYEKKIQDREEDIIAKNKFIKELEQKIINNTENFTVALDKKTNDIDFLKNQIDKLKESFINIASIFITFLISLVLWLNNFPFYTSFLEKLKTPFLFNFSIQIVIVSSCLSFIFPGKKRLPIVAGILGVIASIILGFVDLK